MSKHSHISAIFDNAFQSRAGSPDVYMSMIATHIQKIEFFMNFAPDVLKINMNRLESSLTFDENILAINLHF